MNTIEFLHNYILHNFLPNPASIEGEEQNILLSVSIIKAFIKSCSIDSRNEQSPTCEVVHETRLTSEISFPTDSLLAQLAEHGAGDLEVVGSILGRDNSFFLLQWWKDPATIWQEILNYAKTRMSWLL